MGENMKRSYNPRKTLSALLIAGVFLIPNLVGGDIHVKSETSRFYMDFERKDVNELWLTEGKSCRKVSNRLYITREDLGVRWLVDPAKKSYLEVKLDAAQQPRAGAGEDIHTVGMYYNPEYDWELKDTAEEKEIEGYRCRRYEAVGEADFAGIVSSYWICEDESAPGGRLYGEYMMEQVKNDPQRPKLSTLLKEHKGAFPVYREETIENAIAPTMVYKIKLLVLEEAEAPAGIYEIPDGYTKIER
jgi:hypothetical protein